MPKCKAKTKFLPAAFAWCLLLTVTALFFAYPGRWFFHQELLWVVVVYEIVVTVFVVMNFSLATFMDPGVIPRAKSNEDWEDDFRAPLYRNVEINGITVRMKWCVTCQFYRPPRCSHCSVCNNCIEIFDHHCPWVNNCIGRRNYRYFFMFLVSLSVDMMSIFCFCLFHILKNKEELERVTKPDLIVSIVVVCVVALLFIPIFGLSGFHMVLVARGRTTNEQVTGKFRGGYNPFSRGLCFNSCNTLCGPQYPSLKHPAKYVGKKPRKYVIPVKPVTPMQLHSVSGENLAEQQQQPEVQMYRDLSSGGLHGAPYNKMTAIKNDRGGDDGSDMDEPMASQSIDAEAPLTHNTSKSNFFTIQDDSNSSMMTAGMLGGVTSQRNVSRNSPQAKFNPQYSKGSPLSVQREQTDGGNMAREKYKEMAAAVGTSGYQSPMSKKVGRMGGVPTPLAAVPSVPSGNRYGSVHEMTEYLQTTDQKPHQLIMHQGQQFHSSGAPATMQRYAQQVTSPTRRYMSEGELLENSASQEVQVGSTGASSSVMSASHLADGGAGVPPPQKSYFTWKDQMMQQGRGPEDAMHPSYASQVGYYLQHQPHQQPQHRFLQQPSQAQAVIQSGGPRTTPSGYPGGPVVPSGQLSPQPHHHQARPNQQQLNVGYSTTGRTSVHQHQPPLSFKRASDVSKSIGQSPHDPKGANNGVGIKMQSVGGKVSGEQQGDGSAGGRDNARDLKNYEISV